MNENETVEVLIQVTRITEYSSFIQMTRGEFAAYEARIENGGKEQTSAEQELNEKIDSRDWQSDEFETLQDFAIEEA